MKVLAVARNLLNPDYAPEIIRKMWRRAVGGGDSRRDREAALRWCEARGEDFDAFASGLSPALAEEAERFGDTLREEARRRGGDAGVLGGAAHYRLLYFLTRLRKPAAIVETGVAAGYSSRAFLQAIETNGMGRLYSSDFPYFRLRNPERHIGVMVDERLKRHWDLLLKGDRRNLPEILRRVSSIDMFHYDSDKSYRARRFALDLISPRFTPATVIVMDDIQDNLFFRDFVTKSNAAFRIFPFEGKFTGVVGVRQ